MRKTVVALIIVLSFCFISPVALSENILKETISLYYTVNPDGYYTPCIFFVAHYTYSHDRTYYAIYNEDGSFFISHIQEVSILFFPILEKGIAPYIEVWKPSNFWSTDKYVYKFYVPKNFMINTVLSTTMYQYDDSE